MEYSRDMESSGYRRANTRVVATYEAYERAQQAVDHLSDEGFEVDKVSIVASDLRFVERVTGRTGYGQAAIQGLSSGAVVGALIGFVFGLLSLVDPLVSGLVLALYGVIFGAIVGALIGVIGKALSGGERDFSSVGGMQAGRYEVVADEEVAEEAESLLAKARLSGDEREA